MPRCAETTCGRWRPDLTGIESFAASTARRLGAMQFNGGWYCSRDCVEQAALQGLGENPNGVSGGTPARAALPPVKLGRLLRHSGAITEAQLDVALLLKTRTGLRIGEQLEQLGYAAPEIILRALARQAGVSYLSTFDVARVKRAPLSLPVAVVRALGLVPFEADKDSMKLHVVCAAPLPRAAMRAMAKLTGWTPEVYLVTDRVFEAALDAYQPADEAPVARDPGTVRTLPAAAAHVAERAHEERAVTMRHATYDEYMWVRVEGSQRVSDVLVTEKETGCQAELIAH